MKKSLFFALALTAICLMPACTKDPAQNKVVFGNSERMSLKSYEDIPLQQYNYTSWGYTIDLNGDGTDDIQFLSEEIGSPAIGRDIVTTLNCLNENTSLLGDIINQEVFLHIDTTELFPTDSTHWDAGIYHTITCNQIAETDSVISSTEKLSLYANNAGDAFSQESNFMSTKVILKDRSYTIPSGSETIGDITYHVMKIIENDCDVFPIDETKYIGYQITENNKCRMGWMKVILHYDHVELLETAIQKSIFNL